MDENERRSAPSPLPSEFERNFSLELLSRAEPTSCYLMQKHDFLRIRQSRFVSAIRSRTKMKTRDRTHS